jgi:parallel beta-helix repeat protein
VLSRRWTKIVTGLVMVVMVVPGTFLVAGAVNRQQDSDAQTEATREQACTSLVDRLVAALDAFTEQFDGLTALGTERIPPMPSMTQLRAEAVGFDGQLAQADCREVEARTAIDQWRHAEGATGPLAEAVRAALSANVVDVVEERRARVRHQLSADEDLATVLSRMPSGATVVLPEGRFALDRTVAFVQDITIEGAGRGRTVITSRAQGAGLVLASQVSLKLAGVRVEHRGGGTASVLLLRAGTAELEDVQITGATRSSTAEPGTQAVLAGGSGIVMAGGERLSMRGSTSSRNAVGGLLVASGAPRVRGSTFRHNDVCGVCYVGKSAGRLRGSVMAGNGAGVMFGDRSAPVVDDNRIEDNERAGLVVEAASRPRVRGNTVRGNGGIGVAVYGTASPRLTANTVSAHRQAGILVDVAARAKPGVQGNELRDNGSAGVVFMGRSGGRAAENTCSGAKFGLVLDGSAAPLLGSNDCALQDQRGRGRGR